MWAAARVAQRPGGGNVLGKETRRVSGQQSETPEAGRCLTIQSPNSDSVFYSRGVGGHLGKVKV